MIEIDGAFGEGGGQILRTSLALSLITRQAFRISNIRAHRLKPGLRRQHVTAVEAAATVGAADIDGARADSRALVFRPKRVHAGEYRFSIGTAGSTTLVFQAVLPALMIADGPSRLTFEGGTHNSGAPPFDYLDRVFLPVLNRMGPTVRMRLLRHGFAPGGRGEFEVSVIPVRRLASLELTSRGDIRGRNIRAIYSNLPDHVAERELAIVRSHPDWREVSGTADRVAAAGPGNIVLLEVRSERLNVLHREETGSALCRCGTLLRLRRNRCGNGDRRCGASCGRTSDFDGLPQTEINGKGK
ncbi:MAG TPA: RNA 3'-terminal phosphate cyclase [Bryobacteraceae bacterium]|nr:RNA 3'-terminal phosphate cyclase [Bryobacteraceae bacterium]